MMDLIRYIPAKLVFLSGIVLLCLPFHEVHAQHQALAYLELGGATPAKRFHYGMACEAQMRLSPLVTAQAGLRLSNQYPSGFGNLKAGATVFFSPTSQRWATEHVINFSNYAPYPMNHLYYRLTAIWQVERFRIDFGNAFAFFMGSGVTKPHLFNPSFCFTGILRDNSKWWNASLFIRNFNRFEAHGSRCIEWGGEISARLCGKWKVFCEPYVVTAGNFNGTATFYNFKCHIGGAYIW